MRILSKLAIIAAGATLLFSSVALSEEAAKDADPVVTPPAAEAPKVKGLLDYNAITPEGKTLPEGVLRVRTYYLSIAGDGKSYDKDGNKDDFLMDIKANGTALVAEYGLNDKTSIQIVIPYTTKFSMTAPSDADIQASTEYQDQRNAAISGIAASLVTAGAACGTQAGCETYVRSNPSLDFPLPVAGQEIPAGTPIITGLDGYLMSQFKPMYLAGELEGEKGVGDIEIGALYNVHACDKMSFSVAPGLRLPTGKFTDVEGMPTGRGTLDLGLRINLDYAPTRFLLLSYQNQSEQMLMKGKKKVGDKEEDFERVGVRNHGFLQLGFTAGIITEHLKAVGLYTQYGYDFDGEGRVKDAGDGRSEEKTMLYGLTASGLDYGIPVVFDIEQYNTIAGKNLSAGTKTTKLGLKLYYKF